MPYYEAANLVTVTKTNMIDEMPCAYRTLRVASGPIYILLMYPMNLILPYGHSWPECHSVHLQRDTDRARRNGETAIGGRYARRHVVLAPSAG